MSIPNVKVVGRLGSTIIDGLDPDDDQDVIYAESGTIRLTPLIDSAKVAEASPAPLLVVNAPVDLPLDAEGYVSLRGQRWSKIIDLTSGAVNPAIGSGKATHRMDYIDVTFQGKRVKLASQNIRIAADSVDPATGAVDLFMATEVPTAGGIGIVIGPRGEAGPEGPEGPEGPAGGSDAATAEWVETGPLTKAALSATYVRNAQPRSLVEMAYPAQATTPRVVGSSDGVLWGELGAQLYRSADGKAWTPVGSPIPTGSEIRRVTPTSDGEVLAAGTAAAWKSSGWTADPAAATWAQVWQTPDADTFLAPFSLDFNDPARQIFLLSHYTGDTALWPKSRYVWRSVDAGSTWSVVYDSVALYGAAQADASHVHGVCYDRWADRLWVSEGHESVAGVRYSDDDGATWTKVTQGELGGITMAPTTMVATPTGICCGSDDAENGVYGIARVDDPADLALEWLWQWRTIEGWSGTAGFGAGGWYDPASELAYISFQSGYATVDAPITFGNGVSAAPIAFVPTDAAGQTVFAAFPTEAGFVASSNIPGRERIVATMAGRGDATLSTLNRGGILDGEAPNPTSVAVGLGSSAAATAYKSVAVGVAATAAVHSSVAVGYEAAAAGQFALAVGYKAAAGGGDCVAIGSAAKAGASTVAVGAGADLSARVNSVAVGYSVSLGGDDGVVIGGGASASTFEAVVIGARATSARYGSVAIGSGVSAQQERSVAIGSGATLGDSASSIGSVAIGAVSSCTAHGSVAIGLAAACSTDSAVAIGAVAKANHVGGIALGYNTATTHVSQLAIGDRHIEVLAIGEDPAAPAASAARFFTKANGSGKLELRVRFPTGATQIIATEP